MKNFLMENIHVMNEELNNGADWKVVKRIFEILMDALEKDISKDDIKETYNLILNLIEFA